MQKILERPESYTRPPLSPPFSENLFRSVANSLDVRIEAYNFKLFQVRWIMKQIGEETKDVVPCLDNVLVDYNFAKIILVSMYFNAIIIC